VHYRDIIDGMKFDYIESANDFKWQSQLRFYIDDDVFCRQINSKIIYGYEYLGVPGKLAITPLTDRCWMTITSAIHIRQGCSPAGPAGTGKTESVKDLAKNLGKFCVVVNCSEQTTVGLMHAQFLGTIFTGAWICLDEFNRIDIEVLSVIAQQVLTMRNALASDPKKFYFSGQLLEPVSFNAMGVFTTMNPGYAGRTELPDNLKVLFRPVSMMVPDYALIAEICLMSTGYADGKILAIKMTKLFKLASEQLSQQCHYDFGMRAVKAILSMAGNLKREFPATDEDLLIIRAMRDVNVPKFLKDDIFLFDAIVQD
jgi:dynein heavy chain